MGASRWKGRQPCSVLGGQDRVVPGPEVGSRTWETVRETSRSRSGFFSFFFF